MNPRLPHRKSRRRFWVILFVLAAVLLTVLATGWNLILVQEYHHMVEIARRVQVDSLKEHIARLTARPWLLPLLGTLGFGAALTATVLFFVKLLREMKLNQLQSEFLARVSHELKSPLSTLELSTSLLKSEQNLGLQSAEERAALWESMEAELKRLRLGVENLLESARWDAKAYRVQAEDVQLKEWLESRVFRWRKILGPGAQLKIDASGLQGHAWLDPRLLDLIGDNLVDNARKFARGAPQLEVRAVASEEGHGRWRLEFRDQGWGFSPEAAEKLGQRFFRAQHATPTAIPGSGLGLYLAASACRAQGLRLSAQSQGHGQGALFSVEGDTHA